MIKIFYEDFKCTVEGQGEMGKWFDIKTGVKQGFYMSGFFLLIVIDWVMRRTVGHGEYCIRWKLASELDNLDFTEVVLISSTKQ